MGCKLRWIFLRVYKARPRQNWMLCSLLSSTEPSRASWSEPAVCRLRPGVDLPPLQRFTLVPLVDDVVAVEDAPGLVTCNVHGDALGDAGADYVAYGSSAQIVK